MKAATQCGRILWALVRAWPCWIGGYEDGRRYGFSWHTASQRCGDLGSKHGFATASRRREGEAFYEYRLADHETFKRAYMLVKSWDTGIDVATLAAQESLRPVRQEALALAGGGA